jgi:hypothetical protein
MRAPAAARTEALLKILSSFVCVPSSIFSQISTIFACFQWEFKFNASWAKTFPIDSAPKLGAHHFDRWGYFFCEFMHANKRHIEGKTDVNTPSELSREKLNSFPIQHHINKCGSMVRINTAQVIGDTRIRRTNMDLTTTSF